MTPLEQIVEYAHQKAHASPHPGSDGWAHGSFHDVVLAHGRVFEPAPLPENIYPALPGHCFKVATILADQHALTYVEGLVLLPDTYTVTEHAWCATWSGRVIDPSLGGRSGLAYLGVAFTMAFRRQAAERPGGRWSVLTADQDGGTSQNLDLLRHGLPETAILRIGKPPGILMPPTDPKPAPPGQRSTTAPPTSSSTRANDTSLPVGPEGAPQTGRHREAHDTRSVLAGMSAGPAAR